MRASLLLLLTLSSVLVAQTDGSFWTIVRNVVKAAVNKVAEWVNENLKRAKKSLDAEPFSDLTVSCEEFGLTPGMKMNRDMLAYAFEKADANKDGELKDDERTVYEGILAILIQCLAEVSSEDDLPKVI